MPRVAIIADSHFDEHSRFAECIRLHQWIAEDLRARGVDAVVHTGDVYERKSTPLERQAVADWVRQIADFSPMLIIRGNHDAVDDLPLLARLSTRFPVTVEQEAGVHLVGGINVAALAWPRKAALLAASGADGKELGEAIAGDALRAVLRGLGQQLEGHPGPRLFAAHAMVRGSVTSTGQPLVGCDMELGLEDLALVAADTYALGHIHKGQRWDIAGAPVVYPGSPRRTAFGELEPKGYTLLEWDMAGNVIDVFVEAPATRMVQLECEFAAEHIGLPGDVVVPAGLTLNTDDVAGCAGAEVRLRYHVTSDRRDEAKAAAGAVRSDLLAAGALTVKVEEIVETEQRARSPEVAAARTLEGKLEAYWLSKRFDPSTRRAALLAKAHSLEENNHAS